MIIRVISDCGPEIDMEGGVKKRRAKNKATKTSIVFDVGARKEFLTGFRKRKNERRRKAKEQLEREVKEEIKRAKWVMMTCTFHSQFVFSVMISHGNDVV